MAASGNDYRMGYQEKGEPLYQTENNVQDAEIGTDEKLRDMEVGQVTDDEHEKLIDILRQVS